MDLDQLMNRFRLASRHLRNHYFHPPDWDDNEWNVVEYFEEVARLPFENLVLCPAGLERLRILGTSHQDNGEHSGHDICRVL